jgi:raffinose/stachyose/melibiose transport system substrate-binding protein
MEAALKNGYYASVTGNKGWKPVNENYSTIFLNAVAGPENVYKAVNGQKAFTAAEVRNGAVQGDTSWTAPLPFGFKRKLVLFPCHSFNY